jgi:pantoate--beta-alanine ligase
MRIVTTFAAARTAGAGVVGLVPTMGYLHEGHLSLIAGAREGCDTVVASIFVNPLQFGPGEDLERYPRDPERDAAMARAAGVDVLFTPPLEEMYPEPPLTRVTVEALAGPLCGRARPGHFTGVATVVAKLFAGLQPDLAYFGAKDAQQLAIVRRLAADLSFPVEVVRMPLVRDHDGLALSSRNAYLAPADRERARALSRGLFAAADAFTAGETSAAALTALAAATAAGADLEYAELVRADDLEPLAAVGDAAAFLAVAARIGPARLIDNVWFLPGPRGTVVDRGVFLDLPSVISGGR